MRNILKKAAAIAAVTGVFMLSGCFGLGGDQDLTPSPVRTYDYSQMHLVQLDEPYEGQPTAEIETTLGTIKAVLYPEYAPNTVSNFVNRANEGFYNGKDIYCILQKAMFMSGAENDKKNSGVTEDGELIANEYSVNLWPLKGAICSFNGHPGYGDSRFFVLNEKKLEDKELEDLRAFRSNNDEALPEELINAFLEKGVVIDFSGGYTIFAQTIEGFDVIEKICSVNVSGELSMPDEPIYINKVTIGEYHKGQ